MKFNSTIAAVATGTGGGIGVVRISGEKAIEIADKIWHGRRKVIDMPGYTGALGKVSDKDGELDEAVLFVFRAPRSYTGEDVVELSCHGGAYVLQKVLSAALAAGAMPAGAGEFTKRAFLNGKMTLTQAESVTQLIAGESRQAVTAALHVKDGALFRKIDTITNALIEQATHITAWIDYPEEDVGEVLNSDIDCVVGSAKQQLEILVNDYDKGRLIREGISTAIVGSPNVGKSTLMNLLAGYERSIVTDIAGTTRDVIEDRVRLGELILNISDTAGIRVTEDVVEKIGVERSMTRLKQCDLILAVFDSSVPLTAADITLLEHLDNKLAIGICNKSDLPCQIDREVISQHVQAVVEISAKGGTGIDELTNQITQMVGIANLSNDTVLLANQRQLSCALEAIQALQQSLDSLHLGETLDIVSMSLEEAIDALLSLTGKKASTEVIEQVFEQFCVGK